MTQPQIDELKKTVYAICKALAIDALSSVTIQEFAAMRAQIAVALITRDGMDVVADVGPALKMVATEIGGVAREISMARR